MNNNKNENKSIVYPVHEIQEKGKLVITKELLAQITYLHATIGKTEWSGVLLYDVVSGSPSDITNFKLKAKHIFLMDIGNAAYTEYDMNEDIISIYDNIENAINMKTGHIHTHHDMNAFFSGTDTSELMNNCDKHNYYLSLIVNFSGNYSAKVAFLSDVDSVINLNYRSDDGQIKSFQRKITEKQMVIINMDIVLEYNDKFFFDRVNDVKEKIRKEKAKFKKDTSLKTYYPEIPFYKNERNFVDNDLPFGKKKEIDPDLMTKEEINRLLANLLTFTCDMSERRKPKEILESIADSDKDELPIYYDFFSSNILNVIDSFFDDNDTILTEHQMTTVVTDVILELDKYGKNPRLKDIIDNIIEVIREFSISYSQESEEQRIILKN